jgi:positive phototaxis protein PixI
MQTTSSLTKLQELLPQLFQTPEIKGDRHLRFSLNDEVTALIPLEKVQHSLLVSPEKITPIPSVSSTVIGLTSSQDAVFCVFDLGEVMGLPPLSTYLRQYHVIVVRMSLDYQPSSEILVGFAVHKIQGVNPVEKEQIEKISGDFPSTLKPYFRCCIKETKEELMILDLETIFSTLTKLVL